MQLELSRRITLDLSDVHVGRGQEPSVEIVVLRTDENTGLRELHDKVLEVPTARLRDMADALTAFANVAECQARFHCGTD